MEPLWSYEIFEQLVLVDRILANYYFNNRKEVGAQEQIGITGTLL